MNKTLYHNIDEEENRLRNEMDEYAKNQKFKLSFFMKKNIWILINH